MFYSTTTTSGGYLAIATLVQREEIIALNGIQHVQAYERPAAPHVGDMTSIYCVGVEYDNEKSVVFKCLDATEQGQLMAKFKQVLLGSKPTTI